MALVKYNNNSISAVTATGLASGAMTHIKTLTASSSATLSFVDGTDSVVLDSTYPIYVFKFINMHPANADVLLMMNLSTDSGSNYNVTKTTTLFYAGNNEADSATSLSYYASKDLAQGTGFQAISLHPGDDNDQSCSGEFTLYNPSSTTFVKHFISRISANTYNDYAYDTYCAGYANTTSAVDAIRFQVESGNIDAGQIKLYGIKDS